MRNKHATQLIFELSQDGRKAVSLPVALVDVSIELVVWPQLLAAVQLV